MEPLQASDIPCSQDSINNFSPQGLYPTREIVAKGPQELFSNNSWGEELDYLQLTEAQTNHKFTSKQWPAGGRGFHSIPGHHWGQGGFSWGGGTEQFLQGAAGTDRSPWGPETKSWSVVGFFFFSLRVLTGEIYSEKSHFNKNTRGGERGPYTST